MEYNEINPCSEVTTGLKKTCILNRMHCVVASSLLYRICNCLIHIYVCRSCFAHDNSFHVFLEVRRKMHSNTHVYISTQRRLHAKLMWCSLIQVKCTQIRSKSSNAYAWSQIVVNNKNWCWIARTVYNIGSKCNNKVKANYFLCFEIPYIIYVSIWMVYNVKKK